MTAATPRALRKRTEEIGLAIGLLTRLPLPAFETRTCASLGSAFWAYPLAGALIGAVSAAILCLAIAAGFTPLVAALMALAAGITASGGFHEDGLSDFWDGLGGGRTREEKLAIMRDSRIGTYGAMALLLTIGMQIALIVDLQQYAGLETAAFAIIAAEIAARGAIAMPACLLEPARTDGLGRLLTGLQPATVAAAILIAVFASAGLLGLTGIVLAACAAIGALGITLLAGCFLRGFTGDVLGAAVVTARLFALAGLVLVVTP